MSSSNQPPVCTRTQKRSASTTPTPPGADGSLQTPSSEGFWITAMSSPGHATTPVTAAQSHAPSMTSFASENAYQTLDNATTDDESANLLTPPELPVDLPTSVFPVEDVAIDAPELLDVDEPPIDLGELLDVDAPPIDLGVDGPRIDLGDGNAILTAL